jgi:Rrf2 family nitric oxide-sensitive transcriptional repressor
MISRTAEYALRAVVHLAAAANSDSPSRTVGQIAAATRVPEGYLSKVLQSLSRSGVITSQRGLGGGFRLARAAGETSIYDVIQAIDPLQRIHQCPLGIPEHTRLCPLHKRLDDAMSLIEEQFRATTIAELLEESDPGRTSPATEKRCAFPLILQ